MIEARINLAMWGIGEHAQRNILPAVAECSGVQLLGVFTRNAEVREKVASKYGCHAYGAEQELLSDRAVSAIYLGGPNGIHFDQIERCLRAGKSVLVEKTALANIDDANTIVALAKSKRLIVMEAFMYRFHEQFKVLKCLLTANKYGEIHRLECEFGFPHLDPGNIRYSSELEGGALNDAGAYTLSSAIQLLGSHLVVKGAVLRSESAYQVDTKGFALLQSEDGTVAQCSWVFGGSYVNQIKIWCKNAHIVVERAFSKPAQLETQIKVWANGQCIEEIDTGKDNHFINMLDYFSESVASEKYIDELDELLAQAELLDKIKRAALA